MESSTPVLQFRREKPKSLPFSGPRAPKPISTHGNSPIVHTRTCKPTNASIVRARSQGQVQPSPPSQVIRQPTTVEERQRCRATIALASSSPPSCGMPPSTAPLPRLFPRLPDDRPKAATASGWPSRSSVVLRCSPWPIFAEKASPYYPGRAPPMPSRRSSPPRCVNRTRSQNALPLPYAQG